MLVGETSVGGNKSSFFVVSKDLLGSNPLNIFDMICKG